ncbi:MAG TPA: hypothetical protein VFQ14_00730 [Thermoleophilaceae bacterium]|nr:hypothetical protein [Thermoleophilaceae bacterium]
MFGGIRGGLPALVCAGALAATIAAGCGGGDDESTAKQEPVQASAAGEPAETFIARTAKLIETTAKKKDCAELEAINNRSMTRFSCPADKKLRDSLGKFEVVGVEEYGTGAVVDYKSGQVEDGAAIVLFVGPTMDWGIGRFGILSKPSTGTSDAEERAGYAKAVEEYLEAVRERDCDAYVDITFNGGDKKNVVCKEVFPGTKGLADVLKANPNAKPRYEGGNAAYGFYSLEAANPQPSSVTISVAKAKGPRPYVVLDVTPSPTAAAQKKAQLAREKSRQPSPDMTPSSKPSDPAVTTP